VLGRLEVAAQSLRVRNVAHAKAEAAEERRGVLGMKPEGDGLAEQREQIRRQSSRGREQIRFVREIPKIHHQLRAGGAHLAQRPQRRLHGRTREVHRHALPDEEGSLPFLESRFDQLATKGLHLEIDCDALDLGRRQLVSMPFHDARLAGAGCRMVDLVHRPPAKQSCKAIRARIVTGSQDDDLVHAAAERLRERIIDVTVAGDHEPDEPVAHPVGVAPEIRRPAAVGERGTRQGAEEPLCVRIIDHAAAARLGVLVGPHQAHRFRGSTGKSFEHGYASDGVEPSTVIDPAPVSRR
jgi:hypothetical protein